MNKHIPFVYHWENFFASRLFSYDEYDGKKDSNIFIAIYNPKQTELKQIEENIMHKTICEWLENIRLEYDLGYEPVDEQAVVRAIEIIKENDLDEDWNEEMALERVKKLDEEMKTNEVVHK